MQDIMNLMESQKGTLRAFRTIFPNLPLMTGSLADASFLKMILYIATTAVILAVFSPSPGKSTSRLSSA